MSRGDLPTGCVTFLFTDVEGSTRLLEAIGEARYAEALAGHRATLREAFTGHGGVEVDTQGDAFFYVFADANEAVAAAAQGQQALADGPIRVRMGLHTGEPVLTEEGYVGREVHRGARIAAAGHGGQVLLSRETRELVQVEATDLGEHRVKDFTEPAWIFQLGSRRFPPLKTISNTNLPRPASRLIGREKEVAEVVSLLRAGGRFLTLTGPGGSGKTRLAIEAASDVVGEFKNGVFWVGLAALLDAALVLERVAETVGAKNGLAEHVGDRDMLLLLDNFEQVVEAAPELAALVEACPHLSVLVTSREVLRVRGEVEYAVPPLAGPEAVQLFCTRSGLAADQAIAELCRHLDNLPLAVELAAARTSVLSPTQIQQRLSKRLDQLKGGRDAEARQRTLRAAIAWSHDLLAAAEQGLFARLAVFAGGCTLDAAEAVVDADLDALQSLVDKSLLQHSDERFWMLETIREFALERLDASGDAEALRRAHAEHFLAVAEEAEPAILGVDPQAWLDRMERDHDNLRAALDWLESTGDIQAALQLAGTVWEFWCLRGHASEGWRRLEHLLELDHRPTLARAKALTGSTHLSSIAGADDDTYAQRAEQAVTLHRELGDAWGIAYAEFMYAARLRQIGDSATAAPLLEQSVRRLHEVGDDHHVLQARRFLAGAYKTLGDHERFRVIYEENLQRARAIGDAENEAWALESLAAVATEHGQHREALTMLEQAHHLARNSGIAGAIDMNLVRFGHTLASANKADAAVRVLALAEAIHQEHPWTYEGWLLAMRAEAMERSHAQLDETEFAAAWEAGRHLSIEDAVALALTALD